MSHRDKNAHVQNIKYEEYIEVIKSKLFVALKDGTLKAWGKPATWVDCQGMVEGDHLGIAILNHPGSFRHPTTWHVRDYGLFCANPFGLQDFDKANPPGNHIQKKGEVLKFRYRLIFHKGDEKAADIAGAYANYAKESR